MADEVDAPLGQGRVELEPGSPRTAVVEELERHLGPHLSLKLPADLARLGEEILRASARAAADRLVFFAERLVEAPELRVLTEGVVEDGGPGPAHPEEEDVHAGNATRKVRAKSPGR